MAASVPHDPESATEQRKAKLKHVLESSGLLQLRSNARDLNTNHDTILHFYDGETRTIPKARSWTNCKTCQFGRLTETLIASSSQRFLGLLTYKEVLRSASERGTRSCASCTVLRACIAIVDPHNREKLTTLTPKENYIQLEAERIELYAPMDQLYLPFGLRPRCALSVDTSSRATVEWTSNRLSACTASHRHCQGSVDSVLPDRILDIGLDDSSAIYLLENSSGMLTGKYVALSHCWGGKVPECCTTSKTLEARKRAILFEHLPKTFRDAVTFTRALGFGYLWIDSICIIQDNVLDWQVQAAKMCEVYSQAFLTLAATYSPDCDGGLFSVTEKNVQMKKIASINQGDRECQLYARNLPPIAHFWNYQLEYEKIPPLLYQRAWSYQERLLSRRVISFTPYELEWECMEAVACECCTGHEFYDGSGNDSILQPATRLPALVKVTFNNSMNSNYDLSASWARTVTQYSGLALSKESDKLPAIAGLAAIFGRRRPHSRYLAGMWSDSLETDLAWHVMPRKDEHITLPQSYRAPSWSWASVNARIKNQILSQRKLQALCTIRHCSCEYANGNMFSEVLSGRLIVSSKLLQCKIDHSRGTKWWHLSPNQLTSTQSVEFRDFWLYPDYDWHLHHPMHGKIGEDTEVFLLQLGREGYTYEEQRIYMLILIRCGQEENLYRRIGMIHTMDEAMIEMMIPLSPVEVTII